MYGGTCYLYRMYVGSYGDCSGVKASDGYCYYNDVADIYGDGTDTDYSSDYVEY